MSAQRIVNYTTIKIRPEFEVKMIGILRKSGQPFKVVSIDEYCISVKQRNSLKKNNIPFTPA